MNSSNKRAKSIVKILEYYFMSIFYNLSEDIENKNYDKLYDDSLLIIEHMYIMKKLVSN
jgi:hypothetical protein